MPANRAVPLVAREALGGPYVLLSFRHQEVAHQARAGQFVMIKAAGQAEPLLRRPFSILDVSPADDTFRLFIKTVGEGTRALSALQPGELAHCLGPLGRPFTPPPEGREAVMVAGGYGIAPFHLFCRELRASGHRARVFYGGRTLADLQMREPFAQMGVPVACATDDGSFGDTGRVTVPLEAYLDRAAGPMNLYACGPDAMLHAVAGVASRRSLPAQVSLDPWMGCGLGTCLGCVVRIQKEGEERPRLRCACTEGPVFEAGEVIWA